MKNTLEGIKQIRGCKTISTLEDRVMGSSQVEQQKERI